MPVEMLAGIGLIRMNKFAIEDHVAQQFPLILLYYVTVVFVWRVSKELRYIWISEIIHTKQLQLHFLPNAVELL